MEKKWRKFSGQIIHRPIAEEVMEVMLNERKIGNQLSVCIGTDSQVKAASMKRTGFNKVTEFATVVVFIRKGKGGFMYIHNEDSFKKMSIKERMLQEVAKSIEVAYALCNIFSRFDVPMEVHADINTSHEFKSNDALKDAMGYILGMGFAFKAKPDAFASSSCANKVVQ